MNNSSEQLIEEAKKRLAEHPALKFANAAITLQAMRSGTKGYEGKENLNDFLEAELKLMREKTIGDVRETIESFRHGGTECNEACTYDTAIDELLVALIKENI